MANKYNIKLIKMIKKLAPFTYLILPVTSHIVVKYSTKKPFCLLLFEACAY